MNPQGLAVRALAWLGAAMAMLLLGAWAGYELAKSQADAKASRQHKADLVTYQRQVAEGNERAASLQEQLNLQGRYVATLHERTQHAAPLAIVRTAKAAVSVADKAAPACPGVQHQAAAAIATDDATAELAGGADLVVLSLAAVSLWNSALAGHDVSAGACAADDPASPACAAGAGIGLGQLWANHQLNAASCAADRARHAALIDHLHRTRP